MARANKTRDSELTTKRTTSTRKRKPATAKKAEKRSGLRDPAAWVFDAFGGEQTVSGERVTEETAMAISAWYACIRNISEDLGKLDWILYRRLSNEGRERATDHPRYRMLHDEPNPEMSSQTFRETILGHALGWGNGYAEIVRNRSGEPVAMFPLDPTMVRVLHELGSEFGPDLMTIYEIRLDNTRVIRLPPRDVFHVHGLGFSGMMGYNLTRLAREAIGSAIAAQKFGGSYFGNGAAAGAVLQHPTTLGDEALGHLRNSIKERYSGAKNANRIWILEEGMQYQPYGIPPENAQFVETRQFHVEDVCRWFRMPPHKVQHLLRATFSNIEHQSIEYSQDTLMPWGKRLDNEARRKLLMNEDDLYSEHLFETILRADIKTRSEAYKIGIEAGYIKRSEVRQKENMPFDEDLDNFLVSRNFAVVGQEELPPVGQTEPAAEDDEEDEDPTRLLSWLIEPTLAKELRLKLNVAADKLERSIKSDTFDKWADGFIPQHKDHVRAAITDLLERYCLAYWKAMRSEEPMGDEARAEIDAYITTAITRYIQVLINQGHQQDKAAAASYWRNGLSERLAANEIEQLTALMRRLTT